MSSINCIFCRIVSGEIQASIIYEDDLVIAFRDINPQAPKHILIIPRNHVDSMNKMSAEDKDLVGHLLIAASSIASQEGIAETGYRTVINTGEDGGQTVWHLHVHLLGGRSLGWPPG